MLPYLGVFVYLSARGHKMHERAEQPANEQAVRSVAGPTPSSAEEITRLADPRDRGEITEAEFHQAKALTRGQLPIRRRHGARSAD